MGWREDVTAALERLGGQALLDEIYDAVKESRGEDLPESWQSIIRRTLEAFSSDSQVWQKGDPDLFSRVGRGRWALRSTQEVPPTIAKALAEITRADLDSAIEDLDKGVTNNFGSSLKYDVVVGDKRYPPKAVVGLAARRFLGRPLEPDEFSGGVESNCFKVLERNGFVIQKKSEDCPYELPKSPPGNVWIEFTLLCAGLEPSSSLAP